MDERERKLLDKIATAVERIRLGELPEEICGEEADSEEVNRACEAVNRLIRAFSEARQFILSLSEGKLEIEEPPGNFLVSPFKQLHSNLRHLTWQTKQITKGDLNQHVDFLGEFSTSFNAMIDSLREKSEIEKQLKWMNELLERQATTDALTGIANRLKFNKALAVEISKARRHLVPLSLIMLDIDNFKLINDTFGHRAGDLVLQDLADLISDAMRPEDIFARWGGEEFTILLPYTGLAGAVNLAQRLRQKIDAHSFGVVKALTCSFGVAMFRPEDNDDSFLRRTDEALYKAKRKGKNGVEEAED